MFFVLFQYFLSWKRSFYIWQFMELLYRFARYVQVPLHTEKNVKLHTTDTLLSIVENGPFKSLYSWILAAQKNDSVLS